MRASCAIAAVGILVIGSWMALPAQEYRGNTETATTPSVGHPVYPDTEQVLQLRRPLHNVQSLSFPNPEATNGNAPTAPTASSMIGGGPSTPGTRRWGEISPWPMDNPNPPPRNMAVATDAIGDELEVTAEAPPLTVVSDATSAETKTNQAAAQNAGEEDAAAPLTPQPEPKLLPLAADAAAEYEEYQQQRMKALLASETSEADGNAAAADANLDYLNAAQDAMLDFTAPTSCYTCNGIMGGCSSCGCSGCYPGQEPCCPCTAKTHFGRFICGIYQCICCPDPCYDPHWLPIADSAFFVDAARPQSTQRMRWDAGRNLIFPDRAEFFWARADGSGSGPAPTGGALAATRVDYDQISMYTEVAHKGFGFFVEMPYRDVSPEGAAHGAGFADMNLGTKSMMLDCELMQVTFQMKTFLPIGRSSEGLGVRHVSLEPSVLMNLNLARDTYLQTQVSEWIPIGGNSTYEGSILHYHGSLNRVLFRPQPDMQFVVTGEVNGWSFQSGSYTDPVLGTVGASDYTYLSAGPGIRCFWCDKMDFGIAVALSITKAHFADQLYRTEFRFRF